MIRCLIFILLFSRPALAQDYLAEVIAAIGLIDEAGVAIAQTEDPEARIVALTQSIRSYEHGLTTLREAERRLRLSKDILSDKYSSESAEVSRMLAAMIAAGAPLTPERMLHPSGPMGSAHATMILAEILPGLQAQATKSKTLLGEILDMEDALETSEQALARGATEARTLRHSLAKALRDDTPFENLTDTVITDLQGAAGSLEELALIIAETPSDRILAERTGFQVQLGTHVLPVNGRILYRFDDTPDRPGLTVATEPAALVVTPFEATVRYAGRLKSYGNVIMLEPDPGYLLIIGGIEDPFVNGGEVLPKGAPIGLMGPKDEDDVVSPAETAIILTETLYLEARANGDTVDPATWFALDKER